LDAILAPIALYPDQLLTQVLMAAAFPDQVGALANWLAGGGNGALRGDQIDAALRPLPWDPAVKSLAPFPQVVSIMASHMDWMAQIAFAVAEQEAGTFDSVQRLRRQARLAGFLRSTNQQVVRMDGDLIVIAPVSSSVVYVPVYNPQVVYGTWGYPAYPPYYFPPSYAVPGNVLMTGIYFGIGAAVVGSLWGWATPRWRERNFYVDPRRYDYFRQNYHAPAGDWGRWDHDQWRPPVRSGDRGTDRPMPPRPADTEFRPPVQRPGDGQVRPGTLRPIDGQQRPGLEQRPGDNGGRPPPPRPGQGQVRPGSADIPERAMPTRPGPGQGLGQNPVRPVPADAQEQPMAPRPGQNRDQGQTRPGIGQPSVGQDPVTIPHQGQGQPRPPLGSTGESQARPAPSRPAQGQANPGAGQPGGSQNPAAIQRQPGQPQPAPHGPDNSQARPAPGNDGGNQGHGGQQQGGGGGRDRPSDNQDRSGDQRR